MLMLAKFTYDTQAWFHGWSKQCLSSHLSLAWGSKALSCDAVTPWRHVEKVGGFGPGCGSYLPRRRAMNCGLSRWSLTFPKYPKLIKRLNIGVGTSKRSRAEATQKCPPFWPPFLRKKRQTLVAKIKWSPGRRPLPRTKWLAPTTWDWSGLDGHPHKAIRHPLASGICIIKIYIMNYYWINIIIYWIL